MGSIRPYYRRPRPEPQVEADFSRAFGLTWLVRRLRTHEDLPPGGEIKLRGLMTQFPSAGSVRTLMSKLLLATEVSPHIDLMQAHSDPYDAADPIGEAQRLFDKRAAAAIFGCVSRHLGVSVFPNIVWAPAKVKGFPPGGNVPYPVDDNTGKVGDNWGEGLFSSRDLLELKFYGNAAPAIHVPLFKCLAAMAYPDYFPTANAGNLRAMVSQALLAASPGWCGTYGPGVGSTDLVLKAHLLEGNYDMSQMHLAALAYRHFDDLPAAREHLIGALLARGAIHRIDEDDILTSGGPPNDWNRAGFVSPHGAHKNLGETENHIMTINTARYLANQLLYQRHQSLSYDNRRNGVDGGPSCTSLLLTLLRNILRDDFSEYNAKSYQHETRTALLNLVTYAYDHEVRLASRMVLDYISAHMAVSSCDGRRLVPFRRRNNPNNSARAADGSMTVGLTEGWRNCDPMTGHMVMLSGATRAFEYPYAVNKGRDRPLPWSIVSDGGDVTSEMLSDYRLPSLIHDLFVNDLHRRFFQRLHRTQQDDVDLTGRNADNYEIYAGSPSYLISAGGTPAGYAIDPYILGFDITDQDQQLGVAVTTSFMPTSHGAGNDPASGAVTANGDGNGAADLIQFSAFSQESIVINYGVGPDFACGHRVTLPAWYGPAVDPQRLGKFEFVNKRGPPGRPGFYLALLRDGEFTVLEAFDTWLHDKLSFDQFKQNVWTRNQALSDQGLHSNEEAVYTTENGTRLRFVIWNEDDGDDLDHGARVIEVTYGPNDPQDAIGDAGTATDHFLRGTVLNSPVEGVVEITNPFKPGKIVLDMVDTWRPKRTSDGRTEVAGDHNEVWVDFAWSQTDSFTGAPVPSEGDFFRPFTSLAAAVHAVAEGGTIKITPGSTHERSALRGTKRFRLVAPIGGVHIGTP
ncbi:MAG: hypothetical protein JWQ97_4108 [Phenylobacterium sp.]|nr:hypothetical protein [Phenylobacterium sp.]